MTHWRIYQVQHWRVREEEDAEDKAQKQKPTGSRDRFLLWMAYAVRAVFLVELAKGRCIKDFCKDKKADYFEQ
jgi:hypothetical protein